LNIALIAAGMIVLAGLELWLVWSIGERDDRRRRLRATKPTAATTAKAPRAT
jgi:hypothetical protein